MNRWGIGVNTNKSDATGVLTVSGEITIILAALGDN